MRPTADDLNMSYMYYMWPERDPKRAFVSRNNEQAAIAPCRLSRVERELLLNNSCSIWWPCRDGSVLLGYVRESGVAYPSESPVWFKLCAEESWEDVLEWLTTMKMSAR